MKYTVSLKKSSDFRKVYNNRCSCADRLFVIYVLKNDTLFNRLGVSVNKKVGNSVIRHRIKRLIKEVFRIYEDDISKGYDIVFIARSDSASATFTNVCDSVLKLCKRMKIRNTQ